MRLASVLFSIVLLGSACTSLPMITPSPNLSKKGLQGTCGAVFPEKKWQFVHYVQASFLGSQKGFVMGITVISPETNAVDCVIMTLEGFVLFEAGDHGKLLIKRAISPFDNKELAKGLMRDIRLIFFEPQGATVKSGLSDDGVQVCRYRNPDGSTIDIVAFQDHSWEIRQYSKLKQLTRTVRADSPKEDRKNSIPSTIPARLELKSHHLVGYALSLELVSATMLSE